MSSTVKMMSDFLRGVQTANYIQTLKSGTIYPNLKILSSDEIQTLVDVNLLKYGYYNKETK